MDSLLENFCLSFAVDDKPNSTAAPHPYFSEFYKRKGDVSNQANRRKEFLKAQKTKRSSQHDSARNILETEETEERTEWTFHRSKEAAKTLPNNSKRFCNIVMDSEWLVDVPEDLDISWTAVVSPHGKRCVLVAQGKTTTAYDKAGRQFLSFPSWLPGGSAAEVKMNKGVCHQRTVLDCIYSFACKTFFILDVIEWNSHPFINCDTNFRFYWLSSKVKEIKQLSDKSKVNPNSIRLALRFSTAQLESKMANFPMLEEMDPKVDGILFYHNETHYTSGSTPLVGWLKPFMVPEILKISVHPAYRFDVPANYRTAVEYMKSSQTNQNQKVKGRSKRSSSQKKVQSKEASSNLENKVAEAMEEEVSLNQEPSSDRSERCDTSCLESMDDQSQSSTKPDPPTRKRKLSAEA